MFSKFKHIYELVIDGIGLNLDLNRIESYLLNSHASTSVAQSKLKNKLFGGWFVIDMKVRSHSNQSLEFAYTCSGNCKLDKCKEYFHLPLYTNRNFKRIIYLHKPSYIYFSFPTDSDDFTIVEFNLKRVTSKFSKSRMITKLLALHPRYKASHYKHKLLGENDLIQSVCIKTLWQDYCALFDDSSNIVPYPNWIKEFDSPEENLYEEARSRYKDFLVKPLISIIMPVYNPKILWLEAAIKSVLTQTYTNWELCIADDASTNVEVRSLLNFYAEKDSRIKLVMRKKNGHISAASNSALALAKGDWIALLDHDDILAKQALFWVVDAINNSKSCQLIYTDEDKIDDFGHRFDPYFKCDWNLDLFYSHNMFSHFGVYKTELVHQVGGFRIGLEGSQDYDLVLRCIERISSSQIHHVPKILYHWRAHDNSTAYTTDAKPYAMKAGERALNDHFQRSGIKAVAELLGHGYRTRYELPITLPLVTLIIPTRNESKLLKKCIDSILTKTDYTNFEIIIVDNASDETKTIRYLNDVVANYKIKVIRDERPFNYSGLNNLAASLANGEILGLINNDVEVINSDWLNEMVSHAIRPEIGAVGALLRYPDNTIQHAGIVLGIHGIVGHAHRFLPNNQLGYCGRAGLIQSFSAVTGACLVVRKALYEAVGGLNEVELQVACNDIDFCLRLREAGYRNIYTPYAELYHHESASRGFDDTPEKQARSAKEVAYMHQRWGDALRNDPAYSPNLTLDAEDFSLAWPPRVAPITQSSTATTP